MSTIMILKLLAFMNLSMLVMLMFYATKVHIDRNYLFSLTIAVLVFAIFTAAFAFSIPESLTAYM